MQRTRGATGSRVGGPSWWPRRRGPLFQVHHHHLSLTVKQQLITLIVVRGSGNLTRTTTGFPAERQRAPTGTRSRLIAIRTLTFRDASTDAGATLDGLAQRSGFGRRHLDDQAATALDGHAQHDATAFLGDLERPVP